MIKKLLNALLSMVTAIIVLFGLSACSKSEKHSHNYDEIVIAPTCTEQGYTLHVCKNGDDSYKDNYVDALNHDLRHYGAQTATCKNIGWEEYVTCSRCDYTTYEEIAKTKHNYLNYMCTFCYSIAPEAPDTQGLSFSFNNYDQSYVVDGIGTATGSYLKIPAQHNGKPVTQIGSYAFEDCSLLKSLTIPDGVTWVGANAFDDCNSLKRVDIPSSVRVIAVTAFSGCNSLESITVADGNTIFHSSGNCIIATENKRLIVGCNNSVIPTDGSVTEIAGFAFYSCSSLTSITIPNNVISIGQGAFRDCTCLTSITIQNSLASIDFQAFGGCFSLTDINFYGTKQQWNAVIKRDGWDASTGNYTVHCTDGDIAKQ